MEYYDFGRDAYYYDAIPAIVVHVRTKAEMRSLRQICAACGKARMYHYEGIHCYDPEGDLGQFRAHEQLLPPTPTHWDTWGLLYTMAMVGVATVAVCEAIRLLW